MKKKDFKLDEFIAVYTNTDLDCFGLGYVLAVNDDFLLIKSIDPQAEADGISLYTIDDIVLVERNTKYCQKIEQLINLKGVKLKDYELNQKDYISWMLNKSKEERGLINIQLLGDANCNLFGIVKEFDKETCTIVQIDSYGDEDGESQFAIQDISSIKLDCREDLEISYLIKK